jgi:hypothetical protein
MFEFTADQLRDLCREGRVRSEIAKLEERRRRGLRRFWLVLPAAVVLAVLAFIFGAAYDWEIIGLFAAIVVLGVGIGAALQPLRDARDDLKDAVLGTLAPKCGTEYLADGFDPPVLESARRILFGAITDYDFTDLFHGIDEQGRKFAIYEARLDRRRNKSRSQVFSGQVYAWQREAKGEGAIAIVPDRGLFSMFGPKDMDRVRFDDDAPFESVFDVYAHAPASAAGRIGSALRRRLVDLSRTGRLFAYVGSKDVLVAVASPNRFEPGSLFRARPGEERVKLMFDDLCASMAVLRQLRAVFE